jgi:hypothetical protein
MGSILRCQVSAKLPEGNIQDMAFHFVESSTEEYEPFSCTKCLRMPDDLSAELRDMIEPATVAVAWSSTHLSSAGFNEYLTKIRYATGGTT